MSGFVVCHIHRPYAGIGWIVKKNEKLIPFSVCYTYQVNVSETGDINMERKKRRS